MGADGAGIISPSIIVAVWSISLNVAISKLWDNGTHEKTNSKRGGKTQRIRLLIFWIKPPTLEQLRTEPRRSRKGMAGSPRTIGQRITTTHEEREDKRNSLPFLFVAIIRRERKPPTTHKPQDTTNTNTRSEANKTSEATTTQETERAKQSKKIGAISLFSP